MKQKRKTSKLAKSTVLVTGGAGNIGSFIVDHVLQQNPERLIVVDNLFNSDLENLPRDNELIVFLNLDIGNQEEVDYIFKTYQPEYVFHCASMLIRDGEKLPRKAISTNILGTYNIVDCCNQYAVKKICYSSSASVYGEPKYLPVDEQHPFQYDNFVYGWTKISAEMIFLSHCTTEWLGFRYYNVYSERLGLGTFYTQVFPTFYDGIKSGKGITIFGDGTQTMDLIHAEDIARANLLGIESDIQNEFFNVGTGIATTVLELANLMMAIMDTETKVNFFPEDSQKVKSRKSDTKKINKLLGFTPSIDVHSGVTRIIQALDKSVA